MKFDIDEELWYGIGSDEQAEAQAAKSLAARMGRIVGAKPFPAAAQRLAQITRDPNCMMDEVVAILESDPALSARLLRLVNSVGFSLRTPCTSVRHAAALVGTEKLNQVASTAAILDMYESSNQRVRELLEHATIVGALCRYLAFHFGLPPDELFTCGFLHDIGKLMLLDTEGEEYLDLIGDTPEQFDTTFIEERKRFGFDHALLAGHVLAAWNIPHPVPKVVAWHHHVTRAYAESTQISQLVSTLRLADAMSYALRESDATQQIEMLARTEAASYMDISEAQLAAMWDEVRALTERARAAFRGEKVEDGPFSHTSRPSGASLRAVARAKEQDRRDSIRTSVAPVVSERPRHFPCVVCDAPSYAHRCSACQGYMCPVHVAGEDEWCQLCQRDYEAAGIPEIRPVVSTLFGALLGGLLAAAFFGAASAGVQRPLRLMLGPTLILMLLGMLVGVAQRWVRRWWFLRTRPNRSSVMPKAVEAVLAAALEQSPTITEVTSSSPPADASVHGADAAAPMDTSSLAALSRQEPSSRSLRGSPAVSELTDSHLRNPSFPSPPAVPVVEVPARGSSPPPKPSTARERHWMSSRPRTPLPAAQDEGAPSEPPKLEGSEQDARAGSTSPVASSVRAGRASGRPRQARSKPAPSPEPTVAGGRPSAVSTHQPGGTSRAPAAASRASAPPAFSADPGGPAVEIRPSPPPPASQEQQAEPAPAAAVDSAERLASAANAARAAPRSSVQPVTHAEAAPPESAAAQSGEMPQSGWSSVLDAQGTASGW